MIRPATSRNESPDPFESPAVATGTFNVTLTVTSSPQESSPSSTLARSSEGYPAALVCAMLNVAGELPLLRSLICSVWLKSR